MISAAAYVLTISKGRRQILLNEWEHGSRLYGTPVIAEPVARFDHSRRAPLIVFACFEDDTITHIAKGRRGLAAGTGLVRLNLESLEALKRPIRFSEIKVPGRVRGHVNRVLQLGGKLPPKSLGAFIDAILALRPELAARLGRFSESRALLISHLDDQKRANLAVQKETLTTALEITGIETEGILDWSPNETDSRFFLEGLPQAVVREDAGVTADYSNLPGFEAIRSTPYAARVFESKSDPSIKVTVVMANHLPLEKQTGADLIYYNETYRAFVLVQYKFMERAEDGWEFRWRPKDQLAQEIERMEALLEQFAKMPDDSSPASFRLHQNPFFLKLCYRVIFNPDDKGLFPGMYLPLNLWQCLANDPITLGERGGRVLSYENVDRRLTNAEFVSLVANAWVGTTIPQSSLLEQVIREVIQTGKTVTLAVKNVSQTPKNSSLTSRNISLEEFFS